MKLKHKFSVVTISLILIFGLFTTCLSSVIAQFAMASQQSIRYDYEYYDIYNTCDLGLFLDQIAEEYPQAQQIRDMIDESLLYQRGIGQNAFSTGLSIYFPTEITEVGSLIQALKYIEEISTEPAIKAFTTSPNFEF